MESFASVIFKLFEDSVSRIVAGLNIRSVKVQSRVPETSVMNYPQDICNTINTLPL